jgi:sulfatase maturation enzyme AslB (radical SAM superfamily)
MKINNKTFCPLPFTMMSTTNSGDFRTCCEGDHIGLPAADYTPAEVWNSEFYRNLRHDLINGKRNSNCKRCWKWEDKNGYSTRMSQNDNLDDSTLNQIFKNYDANTGRYESYPSLFEFKLGNLCNLKCIMCTQLESSQHQTEVEKIRSYNEKLPSLLNFIDDKFKFKKEIYQLEKDSQNKIIDNFVATVPYLKTIKFVGGEPLINPLTFEILHKISKGKGRDKEIEIITNLSELDSQKIDILNKFQNLNLIVSLDSVDKNKFHYIRYPANFRHFESNLQKLLTHFNGKLLFSITINIFNVLETKNILEYIEKINQFRPVKPMVNVVMDPNYFSILYLDKKTKDQSKILIKQVCDNISNWGIYLNNIKIYEQLQGIVDLLYETPNNSKDVVNEQLRVLKLYDRVRHQSYADLFPYLIR